MYTVLTCTVQCSPELHSLYNAMFGTIEMDCVTSESNCRKANILWSFSYEKTPF